MDVLKKLNKDETYSMLGLLLYASANNPDYSLLHELAYLLDNKSFVRFLKYFEGQTIQVPTIEETQKAIKLLMLYQYYTIEGMDWNVALDKAGFTPDEMYSARTSLDYFVQDLEKCDYKLGGIKNVCKRGIF